MALKINLDLLVQKGIISQEQLESARQESARTGIPLETALEKAAFISEADIAQVLAESIGIPFIDLSNYLIDPEVVKLIPEEIARKYKVFPLFKIGDSLTAAMVDPQDVEAIDEIRKKAKIGSLDPVLSTQEMIQKAIDQYYVAQGSIKDLTKELTKEKLEEMARTDKGRAQISEEAPVIKLVNMLIMQAVKERASDIHIEPEEDRVRIRYRIDGILQEVESFHKHLQNILASRIKVMAKMDIAETRNPQDGRIQIKMENKNLDLRVSSFPTMHGENIVLRILDKTSVLLGLGDLGLNDKDLKDLGRAIRRPNGIILVTGPTGSGKTTTLYAALSTINSAEQNIITIEDPVEYEIPLIRQTQINPRAGLTFANGLRSILRQDPDIIMVGEIRDKETVDIAIQASLTGHLVFSTLHTNDTCGSLTRLIDIGVEPFLIASSITAILAQRLVRVICPSCKERYQPPDEVINGLKISERFDGSTSLTINPERSRRVDFYRGKGCVKCKESGFIGRIGIFELLLMSDEIKDMVAAKISANDIKKKAIALGMNTLYDDGLAKVKNGITTIEELLRVTEEA